MAEEGVQRRLTTILAVDVVGYSRLMERDEAGTLSALKVRRKTLLEPLVTKYRGRVFKVTGDGVLVEFASTVNAVQCAVDLQRDMAAANAELPADRHILLRIGVNLGDVVVEGSDLYGDGVNIAARIEALADPGGICIAANVQEQVEQKLRLALTDLGPQKLKNIERAIRVYRVAPANTAAPRPPLPLPDRPSIAVLPFQNMSGDTEQEYFTDGIVEEIITALSRMRWLFVIARNSSFTYKGRAVDVKQVGRELGVRYVLEGSVRKAADRLRITGQLIEASTGVHLWAERFDGGLDNVFELQDRVASSVIGAIAPKLEQAEIERAKRKPTDSLDAYDYYLRGMASIYRGTKDGIDEGLRLFYKAIELDPDFAAAYGLAAWCYFWRMANGWMSDRPREIAEVTRLVGRVTELGKDDAVALSFSGLALGYVTGDAKTAAALTDRALTLNPNLAAAWSASGWVKACHGDPDAAIEHLAHAMRLSPLDPLKFFMLTFMAFAHFIAGRYDEAWQLAETASREQPYYLTGLRIAAACNALAGRQEESRRYIARLLQLDPDLRLANLKDRVGQIRPDYSAKYVDALRQAGLPE
jgi:TolB-like protein